MQAFKWITYLIFGLAFGSMLLGPVIVLVVDNLR